MDIVDPRYVNPSFVLEPDGGLEGEEGWDMKPGEVLVPEDYLPRDGEQVPTRPVWKEDEGEPALPAGESDIVVGRIWWERPGKQNGWKRCRGSKRGQLERVRVVRYERARMTVSLLIQMKREKRKWVGWVVGYQVLQPRSTRVIRGAPRRMTEREFRKRYRPAQVLRVDIYDPKNPWGL